MASMTARAVIGKMGEARADGEGRAKLSADRLFVLLAHSPESQIVGVAAKSEIKRSARRA